MHDSTPPPAAPAAVPEAGQVRMPRLEARIPRQLPRWMLRRLVVVPILIGLNVLVFGLWWLATSGSELERFLAENFVVSTLHLVHGRVWTLLSAEFSHVEGWHLFLNMFVLWSFGSILERLWGRLRFLVFYLVAAVFASASHCAVTTFLLGNAREGAVGASGAISGLLLAYALLFPKHRILILGILPMPALVAAALLIGLDLWGLVAQAQGGGLPIGHGAHLGGALCGAVYWWADLRRRFPQPGATPPPARLEISPEEAAEIHRLREVLDRGGPSALTPKERAFLERIRERALASGS